MATLLTPTDCAGHLVGDLWLLGICSSSLPFPGKDMVPISSSSIHFPHSAFYCSVQARTLTDSSTQWDLQSGQTYNILIFLYDHGFQQADHTFTQLLYIWLWGVASKVVKDASVVILFQYMTVNGKDLILSLEKNPIAQMFVKTRQKISLVSFQSPLET